MKTKNKRNYLKESGITLIALVVTIIVLFILAGVSVNALFGDSGIIKRAQDAQNVMNKAKENEEIAINELVNFIDNQVGGTTEENTGYTTIDGNRDGLHYHNDVAYTGTCGAYTYEEGKIVTKIIFDFNGGIGNYNSGSLLCKSADRTDASSPTFAYTDLGPAKDGYTLIGWSLTKTATTATYTSLSDVPKTLGENTTYYAVWEKNS